jgi:hypothetical protein
VDDEIRAELEGSRQDRCRDRIVDSDPNARGPRHAADRLDVGNLPHRIGRRLQPQQPSAAGTDGSLNRGQVRGIDELDVEPPGEGELGEPFSDAPVENARDEDVISREQRLEDGGRGRHARREQGAGAARAFERGQQAFCVLVSCIVRAGVDAPLEVRAIFLLLVVGRWVDRGREGARERVHAPQGLCGQRLGGKFRSLHSRGASSAADREPASVHGRTISNLVPPRQTLRLRPRQPGGATPPPSQSSA